jgi:hypothetical protein
LVLAGIALLAAFVYGLSERAAPEGHSPSLATATSATTAPPPLAHGPVALVGDSLSAQAIVQEVAQLKASGWGPVVVNALSGRRIPTDSNQPPSSGIAAVDEVRAAGPDPHTWIVELGTNDAARVREDAVALRQLVDEMLFKIGPGHRVLWVNVHNGAQMWASAVFNRVLDQVASQRRDFTVVNWAANATHDGYLIPDHVHLTPIGTQAFGALIAQVATLAAS